jgi:signal transduction histidine kinase
LLQNYGYKWDEGKRNEQFDRIKKAVDNLTGLMTDVIVLSEVGNIKTNPVEFDIINFIKDIIDEVKAGFKVCPVIHFTYMENSFTNGENQILADKKLIRQIFLNLISNAVKFTPEHSNIYVKLNSNKETYEAEIRDEGIGIPEEDLCNIFEPFIRAKNAGEVKGSGLGLSIVKRAVELLNGKIEVTSKLNEGTTFKVLLPLRA